MDIPEDVFRYNRLIREVEKIDPEAADYLQKDAQKLPAFQFASHLRVVFIWNSSPQGHTYWHTIANQLILRTQLEDVGLDQMGT